MKRTQSKMALLIALSMGIVAGCAAVGADSSDDGDGDGSGSGGTAPGSGGGQGDGDGDGTGGGQGDGDGTGGAQGDGDGGATGGSNGTGGGSIDASCTPFADFEDSNDGFGVYANDNALAGSLTSPASGTLNGLAVPSTGDAAPGSFGALVYAGSGFGPATPGLGPGGIRLAVDPLLACQNVSSYTGISFWAKGTIAADTEWGVLPDTIVLFAVASIADEANTFLDYRLLLDSTWTKHEIPFTAFGLPESGGFTANTVQRIVIWITGHTFNVAIDDVGFY